MFHSLSVIIPARDEEAYLPRCLVCIHEAYQRLVSMWPNISLEVIVVLNRCTDATEQIAIAEGCIVVTEDAKNLSRIRNAGVQASSGEIVVTIDADSFMSRNMFIEVVRTLSSRSVGGGVLILPERWSLGIILTGVALIPAILWYRVSGGMFFCRREDYLAINGFDEELVSVEDIDFAKRLQAHGKKSRRRYSNLFRAHIITSCRKFDRFGDWYFLLHPLQVIRLFRGRSRKDADQVWYDFKH